MPRSESPDKTREEDKSNLYVSNLSYKTREEDLQDSFAKYGAVSRCRIIKDPHTRESRGFGFVTFENATDAAEALESLNHTELDGRQINVEIAKKPRARSPDRNSRPPRRDSPRREYRARSPPRRRSSRSPSPKYRR
jgi:RNA recognition motif-containing protein